MSSVYHDNVLIMAQVKDGWGIVSKTKFVPGIYQIMRRFADGKEEIDEESVYVVGSHHATFVEKDSAAYRVHVDSFAYQRKNMPLLDEHGMDDNH